MIWASFCFGTSLGLLIARIRQGLIKRQASDLPLTQRLFDQLHKLNETFDKQERRDFYDSVQATELGIKQKEYGYSTVGKEGK